MPNYFQKKVGKIKHPRKTQKKSRRFPSHKIPHKMSLKRRFMKDLKHQGINFDNLGGYYE